MQYADTREDNHPLLADITTKLFLIVFQLCNAELLSVHTREENDFITKQLRESSEVNKLWIGMSYKEQKRMWSWIDGSRYRCISKLQSNVYTSVANSAIYTGGNYPHYA